MKKLLYIGIIALMFTLFVWLLANASAVIHAEEITTTITTQEEVTTTTEEVTTTTEEVEGEELTTFDPLDAIQDEAEVFITKLEALVTAFVTSILGSAVLVSLGKVLLDKAIKKFTEKVRTAEAQNKISSERADQLVTAMQVAQNVANAKIDDIQAEVHQLRDDNVALNGSVSELLAELKARDQIISNMLMATLGTVGESDGQE